MFALILMILAISNVKVYIIGIAFLLKLSSLLLFHFVDGEYYHFDEFDDRINLSEVNGDIFN